VGDASSGVLPPPVEVCPEGREPCSLDIDSEPGAEGVTYRTNEAIARKTPLAWRVIENSTRSWQVPTAVRRARRLVLTIVDLEMYVGRTVLLLYTPEGG
jgi:hypothetical protein